jgi:hypothetical protein
MLRGRLTRELRRDLHLIRGVSDSGFCRLQRFAVDSAPTVSIFVWVNVVAYCYKNGDRSLLLGEGSGTPASIPGAKVPLAE